MGKSTCRSLCIQILDKISNLDFILTRLNQVFEISGRFTSEEIVDMELFQKIHDWRELFIKSSITNWSGDPETYSDDSIKDALKLQQGLILIVVEILEKNATP